MEYSWQKMQGDIAEWVSPLGYDGIRPDKRFETLSYKSGSTLTSFHKLNMDGNLKIQFFYVLKHHNLYSTSSLVIACDWSP